eukprot:10367774-Heterocapsa_arctica.AAC.1
MEPTDAHPSGPLVPPGKGAGGCPVRNQAGGGPAEGQIGAGANRSDPCGTGRPNGSGSPWEAKRSRKAGNAGRIPI